MVCTPADAYECFARTEMDVLVLEDCVLHRDAQPSARLSPGSRRGVRARLTCDRVATNSALPFPSMLRLRHTFRLAGEFVAYAVINRVWWILPLMVVLGLVAVAISVTQAAAPYTLYTLF